ncbi:hypothetical protein [Tepidibacter thalassicus]|uniref:Uncharacterized protein n=1 Tax=Tepidibacter thalassicus DSM 15285 TaxID=1123350 RepID=A0A1M5P3C3_9FIRM|nr:hypothetical protein [Tepidibacter thalassicus]SHG96217.1 hypothetical protein SAMN02744040_00363 [Tepidibacter thalassicus DSM 15285]
MQKRNKVDEKNTKKPSILNSNEMNIETAAELGLDIKDSNLTGKLSKEAYNRTIKAKRKGRK